VLSRCTAATLPQLPLAGVASGTRNNPEKAFSCSAQVVEFLFSIWRCTLHMKKDAGKQPQEVSETCPLSLR